MRPCTIARSSPSTATRVEEDREVRVSVAVEEEALEKAVRKLGWRVYATNQPQAQLALRQAVLAYRSQYLLDRSFGRLKGHPLSLSPMYLQRDAHATGLIRLLSIGLRVLTLLEFVARRRLDQEGGTLSFISPGNPKRATSRPTAERLLKAFQEITLTSIQEAEHTHRHLTPLSNLQRRILTLLDFSPDIYTSLSAESSKPP